GPAGRGRQAALNEGAPKGARSCADPPWGKLFARGGSVLHSRVASAKSRVWSSLDTEGSGRLRKGAADGAPPSRACRREEDIHPEKGGSKPLWQSSSHS